MIGVAPEATRARVHVIGGGIDPEYLVEFSQAHEQAGFDTVLIGHTSTSADGFQVAQYVAARTDKVRLLIAHRPGFIAPTMAARIIATADNLTGGRISIHIITGGVDADQRRDGDFVGKDDRYRRTDEYLEILRAMWTTEGPVDHAGEYYEIERARSDVRPVQSPHPPIFFGGASDSAIEVGAKHCDTFALFGEPQDAIAQQIARVRSKAEPYGRNPTFNVSFRPVIADTEGQAWDKARELHRQVVAGAGGVALDPEAVTSQRLLAHAADSEIHDERLFMPIAAATGATGNTTCLVGTPDQVAEAIGQYWDIGVRKILIRGFDPLADVHQFGSELIPSIRSVVADRESRQDDVL